MVVRTLLMVTAGFVLGACAPAYQAYGPPPPHSGGFARPGFNRPAWQGSPPVGRWDNVMLLDPGTAVRVLMKDGRQAIGAMDVADAVTLNVRTASGQVALAAAEVMRVDLLPPPAAQDYARHAAAGAGAAAVGVSLVALAFGGHVPPRTIGAAALAGATSGVQAAAITRGVVTIYLAR